METTDWSPEGDKDDTARLKGMNELLFGCEWPDGMGTEWGEEEKEAYWEVWRVWGSPGKHPLPICVERDTDGLVVASDDIFNVYGVGESWDEAISDYKSSLVEFFEIIGGGQDSESRRLLQHLGAYLKRG